MTTVSKSEDVVTVSIDRPRWIVFPRLSALEAAYLVGIAACLLLQLHLVFVAEFNWDEFYFLSLVHDYLRGDLSKALQTFHVLIFQWLPTLGDEIAQLEAARLIAWLCEAGTAWLIYQVSRTVVSRSSSLTAVLVYLSGAFVMQHGASFRADPFAALLLMFALFLILRAKLQVSTIVGIAAALAIAGLVTVKAIFYAPALAAAGLWRLSGAEDRRSALVRLAVAAIGAAMLFPLLYVLHLRGLSSSNAAISQAMMSSALDKTILSPGLFPRTDTMLQGALLSPVQAVLLLAGLGFLLAGVIQGDRNARKTPLFLLLMAGPLASFIFYRNAFPYFFAFILPPAMPAIGYALDRAGLRALVAGGLAIILTATAAVTYGAALKRERTLQEETIAAVRAIFPTPVPYIDRCSMIAGFPKRGFFMSSWGIEDYRQRGQPVFAPILAEDRPPIVIANSPALARALEGAPMGDRGLLPQDAEVLRANYIHHWGPLWVAGKTFGVGPAPRRFEMVIPGTYTLEASEPVEIDGRWLAPGTVLTLTSGGHLLNSPTATRVTLRWGNHLPRPRAAAAPTPIFWGF